MGEVENRISDFQTNDSGGSYKGIVHVGSEWTVAGTHVSSAGGVGAVTKAAVTGKTHYITCVRASFDTADTEGLLVIADGTTTELLEVHDQRDMTWLGGRRGAAATAVSASISGPQSLAKYLSISGFTI